MRQVRTGCADKGVVVFSRQKRIGKISEEQLQKTRYTVHVMVEVFGVPKVQGRVGRVLERSTC
jgi:hypothetical protein